MSNLKETYVELQKDVMKTLIPFFNGLSGKDCSEEGFAIGKLVMSTMAMVNDLLETIDEMEERQQHMELVLDKMGKVIIAKGEVDAKRYDAFMEEIRSIKKINNNRKENKKEE